MRGGIPWSVGEQCANEREKGELHYPIFWSDCGCAAHVFDKDDAALIVLAVNHHEKLATACRLALTQYKDDIEACGPCDHSVGICICGLIREADELDALLKSLEAQS